MRSCEGRRIASTRTSSSLIWQRIRNAEWFFPESRQRISTGKAADSLASACRSGAISSDLMALMMRVRHASAPCGERPRIHRKWSRKFSSAGSVMITRWSICGQSASHPRIDSDKGFERPASAASRPILIASMLSRYSAAADKRSYSSAGITARLGRPCWVRISALLVRRIRAVCALALRTKSEMG